MIAELLIVSSPLIFFFFLYLEIIYYSGWSRSHLNFVIEILVNDMTHNQIAILEITLRSVVVSFKKFSVKFYFKTHNFLSEILYQNTQFLSEILFPNTIFEWNSVSKLTIFQWNSVSKHTIFEWNYVFL